MVIVAVAFIAILISTLFWVTMANFRMKYGDVKVKGSFYTAETVLEEIKAGLQTQASRSLMEAYGTAYATYVSGSGESNFQEDYLTSLYNYYVNAPATDEYDMKKLIAYVDRELLNSTADGSASGYAAEITTPLDPALGTPMKPELIKTDNKVILKNVLVKFADYDKKNYSEIRTDFAISMPTAGFARASATPDIFKKYALVANDSLQVRGKVSLKKNAYGGNYGTSIGTEVLGASLDVSDADLFVSKGAISINGTSASQFKSGTGTSVYANDLVINSGDLDLAGKTFIANDLVINGPGNAKLAGDYYGYGNSLTEADRSSAVLVNSRHVSLDISGITSMLLAGHAFIGTSGKSGWNEGEETGDPADPKPTISMNKQDVFMDQSIAVKGDQVAYLIPGSCIGVWKYPDGTDGDTLVGMNPIPDVGYKTVSEGSMELDLDSFLNETCYITNESGEKVLNGEMRVVDMDRSVRALGGRPLKDFGTTYKIIYKRQNGKPMAYFYLVLDSEEKAKEYMQAYFGVKQGSMKSFYNYYLGNYMNVFTDPNESGYQITTPGQYVVKTSGGDWMLTGGSTSSDEQERLKSEIKETYEALYTKLVERRSLLTGDELTRPIFNNLILEDKMPPAGTERIYEATTVSGNVYAVISGKDVTITGGYYEGVDLDQIRLIVTTGNIVIQGDYNGLAIAKGNIELRAPAGTEAVVRSDNLLELTYVLQSPDLVSGSAGADDPQTPLQYFKDNTEYVLEGTAVSANEAVSDNDVTDITELVTYENWTKL